VSQTVSDGISVVIPTHGRSRLTERLLASLIQSKEEFEYPSEVLIVDDTPEPEKQEILQICQKYGARYLPGTRSVREKRNLGIKESCYSIVLFVDSDCEATPGLFKEHYQLYRPDEPQIAGCVGVTEFVGADSWMWNVITRTQFLNAFSFAKRIENPPWATCSNTSFRRTVLIEMGGFETKWPGKLGADDTDLGLRMGEAGYRLRSNPKAIVNHSRETWNSFRAVWSRSFRWGRMDVHLYYRRHKDRVKVLLPGFRHLLLLIILASIISAAVSFSWLPLVAPLLWFFLFMLLRAIFTVLWEKKPFRELDKEFAADVLGLAFEFGTLYEAIIRWEPSCFIKSVQRGPVLATFANQEITVQEWAMWIGWLLVGILQAAFLK
jgi:GT2 family glycosyltransferase